MTRTVRLLLSALACLVLLANCAKLPSTGVTTLRPASLAELRDYLLYTRPDIDQFRPRGPFTADVRDDVQISLPDKQVVVADLYRAGHSERAPLVILLHGFENTKGDHAYQGLHLATWGFHCLVVQLPNRGPWVGNGQTLARLVNLLRQRPDLVDTRIDPERIIIAGHSFGGAAVAIALSEGAAATGGVLLDPAGIGKELAKFLGRVNRPLVVIGSDYQVTRVRDQGLFYELVRSNITEVSIAGAHHEDGQFPMEPDADGSTTEAHQITFVSALTAAAFSLGFTGKIDYAWASFSETLKNGRLFDGLKK
jgi:pimeloyl-ACP methyl ester carboxylesterase